VSCSGSERKYRFADTTYGSAESLSWLVNHKRTETHIPVIA
jgi:hypothetical protein